MPVTAPQTGAQRHWRSPHPYLRAAQRATQLQTLDGRSAHNKREVSPPFATQMVVGPAAANVTQRLQLSPNQTSVIAIAICTMHG